MGRFDNIAILSDLDGTLLADDKSMVSRNVKAIKRFCAEGGHFSLSTGRMHYNLEQTVTGLYELVNAPAILCNGTYLYDFTAGRTIVEKWMDGELGYRVMRFVREKFPLAHMRVSCREGYLLDDADPVTIEQVKCYRIEALVVRPFAAWYKEGWYKLVFSGEAEEMTVIRRAVEAEFGELFEYNQSSPHLLEMQMKGITKASMLADFREYYRRQGKEITVYACGDYENDYEMLLDADVAVCPSNSLASIKAISDHTLCSNNEGLIADLVELLERTK